MAIDSGAFDCLMRASVCHIVSEPSGSHAILSGHGKNALSLDYLSKDNKIQTGDTIYTSGKEGIFSPGIAIGEVKIEDSIMKVNLFSDLDQITFININLGDLKENK